MDQKFSAIILAAGRGTRMKSSLPKLLHKVLGVTVLDRVICSVRDAGADDLIVVLGHDAKTISGQLADTDIRVAMQTEQLGTAHALLAALDQQPPQHDDVLVVNGDLPDLDPDQLGSLMQSHRASDAELTVSSCNVDHPTGMGRIVRSTEGTFERIVEQQDVVYGRVQGAGLLADIAYPESKKPIPAIISVHGGRWRGGHKRDRSTIVVKQWAGFGLFSMSIDYRLVGCDLYVTLEPCLMCAGAMIHARINRLVFGAFDPRAGAAGSIVDAFSLPQLNHRVRVCGGVRQAECGDLLRGFFRARR